MKQLRALAWRVAPDLCHAISVRIPAVRAFWLLGRRRRRGPRAGHDPIVVAGFHGAVLGLGEGARGTVRALTAAGLPALAWDVSERLGHARQFDIGDEAPPAAGSGVLITQMNPPELIQLISQTGAAPFDGRWSIGYWAWELPRIPKAWKAAFRYVDEVWTPSHFSAEAIRKAAPRGLPIRIAPHAVALNDAAPNRERFGLPADHVVVLFAFDLRSTLARKNPLAALEAFRLATAQARSPATLVFKTVGAESAPQALAALRTAAQDVANVTFLTETLSAEVRDQLMASSDVFLSLHRSEGFGLLLAEAMAAGKPVIATAWSANLDFMDADSAILVPYALIPANDPQGLYEGSLWAEANIGFAAQALARLIDDPDHRAALGARARAAAAQRLAAFALPDLQETPAR